MIKEIPQERIELLIEKFISRKKFFAAESEGPGPCSILLVSHVRVYDGVLGKLDHLRSRSVTADDINGIISGIRQKIEDYRNSETYDSEKMIIKLYEEIIREMEGVLS